MEIQTFKSEVIGKKDLNKDVILFSLNRPENFSFQAGQFITLKIEKGEETKLRSYSILSHPSEKEKIDLCIKIVDSGFASDILKNTKVGDSFEVKGPFGHFVFDQEDQNEEVWMLGGGTGVAPFNSMLREFLPIEKKFNLIFSVKTKENLFLHQEFQKLEKNNDNFTYIPTLTRDDWDGAKGRVQEHLPSDLKNKTFYICGLKELVLETKKVLLEKGVDPKNVKFERYS